MLVSPSGPPPSAPPLAPPLIPPSISEDDPPILLLSGLAVAGVAAITSAVIVSRNRQRLEPTEERLRLRDSADSTGTATACTMSMRFP